MIYDYQNCIDFAREKGLMDGLAKGEKLAKIETAKNLKNMGLSVSQISLATGLSESEILELINR